MFINEIFYSLQGEGINIGLPTIFIRLSGCNLNCSWCDTEYAKEEGRDTKLANIIKYIERNHGGCRRICITGGEPLEQMKDLKKLLTELCKKKYEIVLETNGSKDLKPLVDLITHKRFKVAMDVKTPSSGEKDSFNGKNLKHLKKKDMLKFVIADKDDYVFAKSFLNDHKIKSKIVFTSAGGTDLKWLAESILEDELNVRVLPQLHKIIWGSEKRGV
jgi:7-carboxy-7-deazaguanine synthase